MQRFWRHRESLLRWSLAALVEVAVVIPWFLLLYASQPEGNWMATMPGIWLLLLVYLLAGLWESGSRSDSPTGRLLAMAGGTFLGYLLAYYSMPASPWVGSAPAGLFQANPALYFVPVAAYLWYRGARSAIEGILYVRLFGQAVRLFLVQFAGVLILTLFGWAREPQVGLLLYWSILLFFTAGLSLLLITREQSLRSGRQEGGIEEAGSTRPAMTALVIGLMGLTLISSAFLSVERIQWLLGAVGRLFGPLLSWMGAVAMLIITRWAMLIFPVVELLRGLTEPQAQDPGQEGGDYTTWTPPEEKPVPLDLVPYLQGLLIAAFVLLMLLWLLRLNRGRRVEGQEEEERESLGFWRSLRDDLQGLLNRFRRPGEGEQEGGEGAERIDPLGARALYRRLQAWGRAQGRARRPAETPNRYQEALLRQVGASSPSGGSCAEGASVDTEEPIAQITALYNQERYGPTAPSPELVAAARSALEQVGRKDFTP